MKKITIKIEVYATVEVELDEDDLRIIAEDYKGNFKSYIEDDLEYDISPCNFTSEDFTYSKEEILKAIEEFAKENGMNKDFSYPDAILKNKFLKKTELLKNDPDVAVYDSIPILLTSDDIADVCKYADYDNPKEELNCIYIDAENIVATDTRRMIVKKNKNGVGSCLIPRAFCELFLENGGSFFTTDDGIYLESNDKFYMFHTAKRPYPDHRRIIPKNRTTILSMSQYLEKSKVFIDKYSGEEVRIRKFKDGYLCIAEEYIEKEFDTIIINEYKTPIVFEKQDTIVVIMPMFFNEDEIKEMLEDEAQK